MYIEKINGPEDVKKLTVDEMTVMAGEMREPASTADTSDQTSVW